MIDAYFGVDGALEDLLNELEHTEDEGIIKAV